MKNANRLNLQCLRFKFNFSIQLNLFKERNRNLTSPEDTRQDEERACSHHSVSPFQQEVFAITFDKVARNDIGLQFDTHCQTKNPWMTVPLKERHDPLPEVVSDNMFKGD